MTENDLSQDPHSLKASTVDQGTDVPQSASLTTIFANAARIVQKPTPGLYLTATPIGNAGDITIRALSTMNAADVILCEDTRVTSKLLSIYGLNASLTAYHDHNAADVRPRILKRLQEGAVVVQVSDAGTPLINDPGYKLVMDAVAAQIPVTTLPGASSPIAALTIAGLPTDQFFYAGFPPAKTVARISFFEDVAAQKSTLVFLESVHRLPASLVDLAQVCGQRPAAICRELTKKFEEVRRGTVAELAAHYTQAGAPKGEVVVVVGPPSEAETAWTEEKIDTALSVAIADGLRLKEAAAHVADMSGWKKRDVYQRGLQLPKPVSQDVANRD